MKLFLLPEDLKTDLLKFLYSQPYGLVAQGVQRLEAVGELVSPPPSPPPAEEKKE